MSSCHYLSQRWAHGRVMNRVIHVTICYRMASTFELGDDQVFKKNAIKDNGRDLGEEYLDVSNCTMLTLLNSSLHLWPSLWTANTSSSQEDEKQEVLWRWHPQCQEVKETSARYIVKPNSRSKSQIQSPKAIMKQTGTDTIFLQAPTPWPSMTFYD